MKKVCLSLAIAALSPALSVADSELASLVNNGKTKLDLRYRFEAVEQEGIDKNAQANTLRTRLSFTSGSIGNVHFGVEFDDVRHLGSDDFNSTANGNGNYPVVADPSGTDVNQLFAKYVRSGFTATAGRQRINLDDQRFVGGVAWRQNEQTYDAARFQYDIDHLALDYSYVTQVNRIFGPSGSNATLDGDLHLLNGGWKFDDAHKMIAFYYDMNFDDNANASNKTLGLRYQGSFAPVDLTASYASQSESGDGAKYSADYLLLEGKGTIAKDYQWTLGYEVLGSDSGVKAFQTPLATGHKFQGFDDKFLGTPAQGIEDLYIGAGTQLGPVKATLTYHEFKAAEGGDQYGTEWDVTLAYAVNANFKTLIKFADFRARDFASDTQKVWLQLQLSL